MSLSAKYDGRYLEVEPTKKRKGFRAQLTDCKSLNPDASLTLANGKKVKGSIEIDFFSVEDLNRILEVLGVTDKNAQ